MKSTLDIMHHAVCYCRRNEDELAAQVIEKCLEQTVAFKRRQAGIKQELNILSRQDSRNRDRAAKVQEILPAGLTAHVSESNVSESYYVRVSDLAGNLIIECRVSGHIRPCGTHENECNNLDEAISTITAALGVGR